VGGGPLSLSPSPPPSLPLSLSLCITSKVMSVSATPSARAERRRLAAHPRGPRARHAHRHGQGPRRAALLSLPAVRPRLRRRALRAGPPRKRAVTLAPGQATDACLAFIGTFQVLSAVVAAAQQRLGSRRVVSATVALLAAIVRRNYSDDVSDSMAARCAPPRAPGGSATPVQCDCNPPASTPTTLNTHRLLLRDFRISASAQWRAGRGWERGGGLIHPRSIGCRSGAPLSSQSRDAARGYGSRSQKGAKLIANMRLIGKLAPAWQVLRQPAARRRHRAHPRHPRSPRGRPSGLPADLRGPPPPSFPVLTGQVSSLPSY
jgi:type II secretory pathway component PulM